MENNTKESFKTKLRNGLIAITCLLAIAGFVQYTTNSVIPHKPKSVSLEFDNVIGYQIVGDSIDFNLKSDCRHLKSKITYDSLSAQLRVNFEDSTKILYTKIEFNGPLQLIASNPDENGVAVITRLNNDSVLVILEKPYFIILSKGKECKDFESTW